MDNVTISLAVSFILNGLLTILYFFTYKELKQSEKNHRLDVDEGNKQISDLHITNLEFKQKINELENQPKKERQQSIELREFLSDLLVGEGLIAVSRVDPNHLFSYSPKDKG